MPQTCANSGAAIMDLPYYGATSRTEFEMWYLYYLQYVTSPHTKSRLNTSFPSTRVASSDRVSFSTGISTAPLPEPHSWAGPGRPANRRPECPERVCATDLRASGK